MAFLFNLPKRWQSCSVWALYIIGLLPAGWAFYLGATNQLGADPVKIFERFLGLWGIRFLLLTLLVTPLRDILGWNYFRYRRALGLLCFYYALMHLAVYMVLDQAMNLQAVIDDVMKRPFIMFGMATFIILLALAVTSNNASIKRLGKKWMLLHRLVYVAVVCAGLHYILSTKVLSIEQCIYVSLLIAMLLYRLYRPIMMRKRRSMISSARG